jgi:hypothetical protein
VSQLSAVVACTMQATPVVRELALQTSCTFVDGSGDRSLLSASGVLARAAMRGSQGSRSATTPAVNFSLSCFA